MKGFYIRLNDLSKFKECKFYIPNKLDWLIDAHNNVNWINHNLLKEETSMFLQNKKSPLCWIKHPTGNIEKFFIVWWDN